MIKKAIICKRDVAENRPVFRMQSLLNDSAQCVQIYLL